MGVIFELLKWANFKKIQINPAINAACFYEYRSLDGQKHLRIGPSSLRTWSRCLLQRQSLPKDHLLQVALQELLQVSWQV